MFNNKKNSDESSQSGSFFIEHKIKPKIHIFNRFIDMFMLKYTMYVYVYNCAQNGDKPVFRYR